MCISDCSRFEYCNLISFNQTNNICQYYFIDSFADNQLIDSPGLNVFYSPANYALQFRINRIIKEFGYLTANNSNINKTTLIFNEFNYIQRQNQLSIQIQGSPTQMSIINSRRIYVSNSNYYSPFYMPYWPSYGELLYIEVASAMTLRIDKARTDLSSDIYIGITYTVIFVKDLFNWKYIGMVKTSTLIF